MTRRRRRIPEAPLLRGDYLPESGNWITIMGSAFGGEAAPSGVKLTVENAMRLSAVFACVRAVSDTVTTLPLHVFQAQEFNGRSVERRIWEHPIAQLLSNPCPELSDTEFWEIVVWGVELRGNSYSEIERDNYGQPVALWPLNPVSTRAVRTDAGVEYIVTLPSGSKRKLTARDVLHIRSWPLDGLTGVSPIRYSAYSVGQGLAGLNWGNRLFRGGGLRRMALVSDTPIKDETRAEALRIKWDATYGGLNQSDRTAILSAGIKPQEIGINPKDAQLLELVKASEEAVCRIFHVPPHKAGFLGNATYNNVEQMQTDWKTDSILPRCVRIERALKRALFQSFADLRPRFNLDGVARATLKERNEANQLALMNGVKTPNECREEDGLEPYEGGDVHFWPMNLVAVNPDGTIAGMTGGSADAAQDQAPATSKGAPSDGRMARNLSVRAAWRETVADAFARLIKRTFRDGIEAAIKARSKRDAAQFEAWLSAYLDGLPSIAEKILAPGLTGFGGQVIEAALAAVGAAALEGAGGYVEAYVAGAGTKYAGWYAEQISAVAHKYGQEYTSAMVGEEVAKFEARFARAKADAELVYGDGNLSRAAWQSSGITAIRWVAGGDACPICKEIDGHVVGIEKSWNDAATDSAAWKSAGFAPSTHIFNPPLHVGCNCSIQAEA